MATPPSEESEGIFDIEEIDGNSASPLQQRSQSPEKSQEKEASTSTAGINEDIELSRRAVPVVEVEEDVCSICLDEFTAEDPEQRTTCEHRYHLQCIMQWAQRSRECPMCFKALQLKDEALNELLPFGEYVPPERLAASAPHFMVGLDAWELEHLLHRLAAANTMGGLSARRERRRHRSHAHASSSAQERHSVDGEGVVHDSGHVRSSRLSGAGTSTSHADNAANGIPEDAAMHPSSWPPPSQRNLMPQSPAGEPRSPHARGMGMDLQGLRSRLAGIKDTFANTTRSLKGRWGVQRLSSDHGHHPGPHNHHRGGSPPTTPSTSSSAHLSTPQHTTSS